MCGCGGKGLVFLTLLALASLLAGCGKGDGGDGSAAHVNEDSGATNGLPLDERRGTPPPPPHETDLHELADKAGCYLLLNLEEEGDEEIPPGSPSPAYKSDVPTSGTHVEQPYQQADGAYMLSPNPIDAVASLDHGRMEIQYAPDLSEEIQLEIKGLYDTMYGGTLLFPNEVMRYAIAAATWRNLLACAAWKDGTTLDAIRAFGKATWGKHGHESVEKFPVSGPNPRKPAEPGD